MTRVWKIITSLDSIVCPESSSCCFLGECEICPGTAKLKENLRNAFNEHGIDEVRFKICLQTPSLWRRFRYPSRIALPWYSSWHRCIWWHRGECKRFSALRSLQRSSKHHILTPQALFQWAKSNCKETEIFFSSKESYAIANEILKGRFDQAVTIPGTLQYHAFISTQDRKLSMKKFYLLKSKA